MILIEYIVHVVVLLCSTLLYHHTTKVMIVSFAKNDANLVCDSLLLYICIFAKKDPFGQNGLLQLF